MLDFIAQMCYNIIKEREGKPNQTQVDEKGKNTMMKHEFIELTGYTPTDEEYHYIEESYYEADTPYKSEFCKQWKKDQKSGKWAMELRFRKMLDEQKAEYEAKIAEQEESLEFYREQFKEKQQLLETVKRQNEKLEALKRRTERLAAVFED